MNYYQILYKKKINNLAVSNTFTARTEYSMREVGI